ncbi:MAG: retropepsin-like domain-containing protein [Clostridia bacterium]|nr:retropepsin-like domain-containing protein [Clostridia bacterium]
MKQRFISRAVVSVLCTLLLTGMSATKADETYPNSETWQKNIGELAAKHAQTPSDETIAFAYAEAAAQLGMFAQSQELLKPLLDGDNPYPPAIRLSAQTAYMLGNYAEAEALYRTLVNLSPEWKEQAESGLLMVYYQTNQFGKSQNLSLAYDPDFSLGALMRAFGDDTPYQIEWSQSNQAVIPFVRTDPLPLVEAVIDGQTYRFVIDTGAPEIHLDDALADSLGIQPIGEYEGNYAGDQSLSIRYGILDSVAFPGVVIESVPVILHPSEAIRAQSAVYDHEYTVDGIIGTGFLKQFLATLDYPGNRLILRQRNGENAASDESATELPFVLASTHILLSRGEMNGKEVNVFLDSGLAMDGVAILVPNATIPYANITVSETFAMEGTGGAGETELQISVLNIDAFQLGGLPEARNALGVSGIFPESIYFNGEIGVFVDTLLSHNFLRDYVWTLDFDSMKMYFSR